MGSKRPLVKQKVTYGAVGDGNLHESDEDFSGKRSLSKRVSFVSHELSDSDSDAENSVGRINRSSAGPAGDSLDGLFRESSAKERGRSVEFIKGTSEERHASKDKYSLREDKGQPRPAPRPRPTISRSTRQSHIEGHSVTTSQQSSDEDVEDMSAITWPIKTKEANDRHPVPPPRTSPRQHQEKNSSSSDKVSPRPVPRSKPALSPSKGQLKLFEQDSDVYEYKKNKNLERDSGGYEYEKTKNTDKPVAPLRRKKPQEETLERHIRPQIPMIRTSTFEDDGPFLDKNDTTEIERDGNLRHGQLKKVNGRPVISVTRSDSSEESEDDSGRVNRTGTSNLFGSKKYYKEEQRSERIFRDPKEESVGVPPKPSPRSRMMVDNSMKTHVQTEEEVNHVKRPGSAPLMKKASSLETLSSSRQGSLTKKALSGLKEQGAQRVQLKKSLTPQRPMSAKKGSLMAQLKAKSDITDTFEEHVPLTTQNIIGTQDDRSGFRKKDALDFDTGGGRSGPLKANQAITTMTRSPHPGREMPTDYWTDTKGASYGGSLTPKRASSMTNLRSTSPESWSENNSARGSQHGGLMDTASIRQAVFDEWKSKKSARLKEQQTNKSAEKTKLEEKEKEERERKKMAKRAFESWNEHKQGKNKEENVKKKELMEKELEKQKEKNLRTRDAKKFFESWKTKKDEELKEQHHKKKEEHRNKKKKDEEEKQEKSSSSQKVYDNWKNKKDEKIKEEMKTKKRGEKDNGMKEEDEKYERSIQSAERYQAWVEKKGKPQREPPPPTLTQRGWCPSGRKSNNCIPQEVGSVIQAPSPNRSRTMSGSYYLKTNKF